MDARDRIIEQRMARRRRSAFIIKTLITALILLIMLLSGILIYAGTKNGTFKTMFSGGKRKGSDIPQAGSYMPGEDESEVDEIDAVTEEIMEQAGRLAAQYEYDKAIALLKEQPDYNINPRYQNSAVLYQSEKDSCVAYPLDQIPHVFFHTLVRDTSKAFDGDGNEAGYNQVMTTIDEFNSIIEQMYERGYVMVSLHDMCQVQSDGTVKRGEILLPRGKIPFVLSQDDVSYYHYMVGDGFANRLIVDENGEVKNSYIEDDGSVSVGDYDMVPLIDTFVKEHPDFAYHGHKGIIALTGYEGVLGYRTDEVYRTLDPSRLTGYQTAFLEANPDFNWEEEVAGAREVARVMKENGWEFASHTWGHINPTLFGYDATVTDTQRWLDNVATVVGDTDVLIFAFGADIGDWTPYTRDNPFFAYLKDKGFSIFCNVDGSKQYWVQFGEDYLRQGRQNLDGYRMYYNPEMLTEMFDVSKAWDDSRPVPVPAM